MRCGCGGVGGWACCKCGTLCLLFVHVYSVSSRRLSALHWCLDILVLCVIKGQQEDQCVSMLLACMHLYLCSGNFQGCLDFCSDQVSFFNLLDTVCGAAFGPMYHTLLS